MGIGIKADAHLPCFYLELYVRMATREVGVESEVESQEATRANEYRFSEL